MRKLALLLLGVTLCGTTLARPQEKAKPESFSGVALGTGGLTGGSSTWFRVQIDRFTTDEEVQKLAPLLKEKGQHDSSAFEKHQGNLARIVRGLIRKYVFGCVNASGGERRRELQDAIFERGPLHGEHVENIVLPHDPRLLARLLRQIRRGPQNVS